MKTRTIFLVQGKTLIDHKFSLDLESFLSPEKERGSRCPSMAANIVPKIACRFPGCEKTTKIKGSEDASGEMRA